MSYTPDTYTADGVTDTYSVTFPYIDKTHVHVYLDDVETSAFTWLTSSSIQFNSVPAGGAVVQFSRITPRDARIVDFKDASNLTEESLDDSALQMFYLAQESFFEASTAIKPGSDNKYDAQNRVIKNLADGSADTDAANMRQLNAKAAEASTYKDQAAASASAAAASEANAATSESNAATSESNAAASEAAALSYKNSLNLPTIQAGDAGKTLMVNAAETSYQFAQVFGGLKNAIINGSFDIWQRGGSFSTNSYTADRWFNTSSGAAPATVTQGDFPPGQTDVPGNPKHFLHASVTAGGTSSSFNQLQQRIEGVHTFAGETVTLSFYAKADGAKSIAVEFYQDSGVSTVEGIGVTTISLTASWKKYTVTVNIPSINGMTIGPGAVDYLMVGFWLQAGSDYNARTNTLGLKSIDLDIAQVQIERGTVATDFERRPLALERALCGRYCQVTVADLQAYVQTGYSTWATLNFGTMRDVPSATYVQAVALNLSSVDVSPMSISSARLSIAATSGNNTVRWQGTVTLDAEL